jgi:hypothetical protein
MLYEPVPAHVLGAHKPCRHGALPFALASIKIPQRQHAALSLPKSPAVADSYKEDCWSAPLPKRIRGSKLLAESALSRMAPSGLQVPKHPCRHKSAGQTRLRIRFIQTPPATSTHNRSREITLDANAPFFVKIVEITSCAVCCYTCSLSLFPCTCYPVLHVMSLFNWWPRPSMRKADPMQLPPMMTIGVN